MDFNPVNSEHSVQSATFSIALDGAMPPSVIQSPRLRETLIVDLPAVQMPEAFEVSLAASGPVPRRLAGIQFSHMRPDGTPAWALRIVGNEIAAECTRYTRWQKVWDAAHRYLGIAIDAAVFADKPRKVVAIGHNVVDVFVANRDNYDLSSLLKPGDALAGKVFSSGSTWHSHTGWFEPSGEDGILWLNQLNVDAMRSPEPGKITPAPSGSLRVQITHNQQLRFSAPISLKDTQAALDGRMGKLHLNNKKMLKGLLARDMATRIGLDE